MATMRARHLEDYVTNSAIPAENPQGLADAFDVCDGVCTT